MIRCCGGGRRFLIGSNALELESNDMINVPFALTLTRVRPKTLQYIINWMNRKLTIAHSRNYFAVVARPM